MFYSDTLLSKTGPLARVWLASNMERKLSKKDCLQSDLSDSIHVMVDQGSAPMALRLSGQLLLGVVRIYSRKARYLLEDCNEALLKIKMAFRPGNVDLPADQSHTANPTTLMLPDVLTEMDLLAPMPDPELLFAEPEVGRGGLADATLDWGTQTMLTSSIEHRSESTVLPMDDLDLDLGEDERSIEIGRRESRVLTDYPADESMKLYDDNLDLDLGEEPTITEHEHAPERLPEMDVDMEDIGMEPETTLGLGDLPELVADTGAEPGLATSAEPEPRERESLSPLSDMRPSVERNLEAAFNETTVSMFEPAVEEEESLQEAAARVKRRKVLRQDADTEIHSSQIRAQQTDRSKILKAASFLPRDPMLLALMNLQKSGGFISSILGDGRALAWAPELRDVLSVAVVKRSGDLKRKRDSGERGAPAEEPVSRQQTPRLEFEEEPTLHSPPRDLGLDTTEDLPGPVEELPSDLGVHAPSVTGNGDDGPGHALEEEMGAPHTPPADFDETTMPLLHPEDDGPISQGTRHAVHLLRDHFGPGGADSAEERRAVSVLFQDLLPERRTSKSDATRLFFEVLVLATKDAVKVEQDRKVLGGPIRIRGKRGLWGAWAEEKTGGETETQREDQEQEATNA
ncbi:hypothetical protein EJ06DRAFT_528267 [Trichodelitschia bisporula]|uniref:Double-strand-break repair protein rad21 n=1 Tax=Trichodelitschia bisporula TaxID=703511 RepID=A0A6G1I2D1_9PEZI|nr:hypothetical protein EJ06DRAFT_528267 [Trichodelitschia bisporula]